jgi:hypothetical protein
VEFLIIWVAFAIGCYFVAKSKGRNAGGWAVAGFFFSFIALIILALLPKRQVFQHPYHSQPSMQNYPPQYGQQVGYGTPQQFGIPQTYPQQQSLPQYGGPAAPQYVPPPVHPQHVPPPIHPQHQSQPTASTPVSGHEQQQVIGSVSVELARLGALHRSGQMSDSDFDAAKRRLLGK